MKRPGKSLPERQSAGYAGSDGTAGDDKFNTKKRNLNPKLQESKS